MLTGTREQKGAALLVRLKGPVDERANFEQVFGEVPLEVQVSCKEVTRINTAGMRAWIKFFHGLQARGIKILLREVAFPIVEQINQTPDFAAGCAIESVLTHFVCPACKSELVGVFRIEDLRKNKLQMPEVKCSKCGGKAIFDDLPEECFAFLLR